MKKTFNIKGMHCNSCASIIERALKDKVNHISASYTHGQAEIDFDEQKISENQIIAIIEKQGYSIVADKNENGVGVDMSSNKAGWIVLGILAFIILLGGVYYLYKTLEASGIQIPELGERTSLIILFLAGLLTGFHCISMCGGFVVSYTAKNALNGHRGFKQHLVYASSKVLSYAVIGGIFGLIGGIFAFSIKLRGIIAILAGIFMIFYALSMFGFAFFRRFQFNPKFLTKATCAVSSNANGQYRAPFFTGLLNGLFLACGPLQAMYLYAAGTGSFFNGAISLAVFGLGTLPVMLAFGLLATSISHKTTGRILKISAVLVLILGLIMLNRGLSLTGSGYDINSIQSKISGSSLSSALGSEIKDGVQEINMEVTARGWTPDSFVLKQGVPVKWNINVKELTGCNKEIIVNAYNLDIKLKEGLNVVEFMPDKVGTISWSCWMGMIPGTFIVTENGKATTQQVAAATPRASSGGCSMGAGGGSCGSGSCGGSSGGGCGCGGSK